MRNFEVTFIVDPVLSGDEIKATAQTYVDQLAKEGATMTHTDEMGLRQLAYPINRRTTGIYYCYEFEAPNGDLISKIELAMRRDERVMRFLTVKLDKYGVKYNDDKRNGLIGGKKKSKDKAKATPAAATKPAAKSAPVAEKVAPAPVAEKVAAAPVAKSEEEE